MAKTRVVIDVKIFLASLFFNSRIGDKVLDSIRSNIFVLLPCEEFAHSKKLRERAGLTC